MASGGNASDQIPGLARPPTQQLCGFSIIHKIFLCRIPDEPATDQISDVAQVRRRGGTMPDFNFGHGVLA